MSANPGEFAIRYLLIGVSQIAVMNRHFETVPACATATLFIVSDAYDFAPLDPGSLPQFGVKSVAQCQPLDGSLDQQAGLIVFI